MYIESYLRNTENGKAQKRQASVKRWSVSAMKELKNDEIKAVVEEKTD